MGQRLTDMDLDVSHMDGWIISIFHVFLILGVDGKLHPSPRHRLCCYLYHVIDIDSGPCAV